MRLYDEIMKSADGGAFSRCVIVPRGAGYFEGVKAVGEFSPERVEICFPKETVVAEGVNLHIKKYCDGDLQLSGRILCVRVLEREGKE